MDHDDNAPTLRRGQRVTYTGRATPALHGREGTVTATSSRNGWTLVRFDGDHAPTKCSEYNLSPATAGQTVEV